MPLIQITAITPANPRRVDASRQMAQIEALLGQAGFAGGMIDRMADYPPQMPPIGQTQSLGRAMGALTSKRSYNNEGYTRTGTLGRGWRMSRLGRSGDDLVVEVTNLVPYAVYVQGPPDGPVGARQTEVMRERGWQNVRDEAEREWQEWLPRIVRVFAEP